MKDRDLLVILGVVLVALFLSSFGAGGMMGFGWMFMWLPILVLIILLVALLGKGDLRLREHRESAIEVLNRRYARGEISREEYLRMKGEIEK